MTDLHNLYIVACPKPQQAKENQHQSINPSQQISDINSAFYLTKSGASEQITLLSENDLKTAYKQAELARSHASQAIQAVLSKRNKTHATEQINDLESIRKKDDEEMKIIRIMRKKEGFSSGDHSDQPELSATRKLFYNASIAMRKELEESQLNQQINEIKKG